MRIRACVTLTLLLLASCDRKPAPPPYIPPPPPPPGPSYSIELQPLTPLASERLTHVAVDSIGNLSWVQETDNGDDTLFVMGEDRIPRATNLTSNRIADALGAPAGAGNIQSITSARYGEIYFYFLGAKGRKTIAGLGLFSNKTGNIRIIADTDRLMAGAGMGRSIALARATLVSNSVSLWLWVRHTDDFCLIRLRHGDIPAAGAGASIIALESARLRPTLQDHKVDLIDTNSAISPAGDDSLFWLDGAESAVNRIDAAGAITAFKSLLGLPVAISVPARDAQGRIFIFAADAPRAEVTSMSQINLPRIRVNVAYPAMLIFDNNIVRTVGRDDIASYPGLSLQAVRIDELILDPRAKGWVAYDKSSGELIRLILRQKEKD